ncbi:MAG: hypothetical protein HZA15_15430 [Nitrospirae bacterium]|nr:hypothetical protein [Nitrospirota bacterium]
MAGLTFKDTARQKWIQFDSDTEVCIELITKPALREIAKKASKRAKLTGEDSADLSDRLLGRAAVKGWRKIGAPEHPGLLVNGEPFPCTPENTDMLMTKSLKFSRFVNEMCLDEDEFDESGEDEKNA